MRKDPKDLPASVHGRLLHLAKKRKEDFQDLLIRFAHERFLYRLNRSGNADRFVLKGAMLFAVWGLEDHRATRDVDLLGSGSISIREMEELFREACKVPFPEDGLQLDTQSVQGSPIRADQKYPGIRIALLAKLGKARIDLQFDIGFGDAFPVGLKKETIPALLDFPSAKLRVYPREVVVAEKFHAMVSLGIGNSRMKDFFDLWKLAHYFSFDGKELSDAIHRTFDRRGIPVSADPVALSADFATHPMKRTQWGAFVRKNRFQEASLDFGEVIQFLSSFLKPVAEAMTTKSPFQNTWTPPGPWK